MELIADIKYYVGHPIKFLKASLPECPLKYEKGDTGVVSSSVLFLVKTGKIPLDHFLLGLRPLTDMKDEEALELSKLVYKGRQLRTVKRHGTKKLYSVIVTVSLTQKLIIGTRFNLFYQFNSGEYAPIDNQGAAFRYLLDKGFDVFNMLEK